MMDKKQIDRLRNEKLNSRILKKTGIFNHFYIKIAAVVCALTIFLILIFAFITVNSIRNAYQEQYSKRVLDINEMMATMVDGDQIERYAQTMEPDSEYYELSGMLYRMQEVFGTYYLYILVDSGDGVTYTYIFDASIADDGRNVYEDRIGAKENKIDFPGAEQVLKTGVAFEEALYYDGDDWGRNFFYSYSPIFNSTGEVVAFLGADIDATPMQEELSRVEVNMIVLSIIVFVIMFIMITVYSRVTLSTPLAAMSADIQGFARGELDIKADFNLLRRKDELGVIYREFLAADKIIQSFITRMNQLSTEVTRGNMNTKIVDNEGMYQGSYTELMENANYMVASTRSILNLMPSTIMFFSHNHQVLYQNEPARTAYEIHQLNQNDSGEKDESTVQILENNRTNVFRIYDDFIKSGEDSHEGTYSFEDSHGGHRYFNMFFIKINEEKDRSGVCAVCTDVSEYIEMSERAEASSRAKTDFLSRMSHEIRTPMNAIIGITEIAKRKNENTALDENFDTILSSANHLLLLINDVLDISKIEAGNVELSETSANLVTLIDDMVKILEKTAEPKRIELKVTKENIQNEWVLCDDLRLKQILINLVSNAIKFSPEGATIDIELIGLQSDEQKTSFRFAVRDHGIGVAPENQKKIFDMFEQGDKGISREYGGTGLGLPISNRLVMLMGSEAGIVLKSEQNKGSEFSFELSFDNGEVKESHKEIEISEADFSGKHLLVVDDIAVNRDIVIAMLEGTGAEIDVADDGSTALEKFEASAEGYYNLILMDIQMRMVDGYEATRAIRDTGRKDSETVKIVAMSANAYKSDIEKAEKAGMNGYITKPVNYTMMINEIDKQLRK